MMTMEEVDEAVRGLYDLYTAIGKRTKEQSGELMAHFAILNMLLITFVGANKDFANPMLGLLAETAKQMSTFVNEESLDTFNAIIKAAEVQIKSIANR